MLKNKWYKSGKGDFELEGINRFLGKEILLFKLLSILREFSKKIYYFYVRV